MINDIIKKGSSAFICNSEEMFYKLLETCQNESIRFINYHYKLDGSPSLLDNGYFFLKEVFKHTSLNKNSESIIAMIKICPKLETISDNYFDNINVEFYYRYNLDYDKYKDWDQYTIYNFEQIYRDINLEKIGI